MKIEIRFTLVDDENWFLAYLYALTSINKRLKKKERIALSEMPLDHHETLKEK